MIIHNKQDIEVKKACIGRERDKLWDMHTDTKIVLEFIYEKDTKICHTLHESEEHYTKWNKRFRNRSALWLINMLKKYNENIMAE